MEAEEDWRSNCKNVQETLAEARRKAMFVDVSFKVGPSSSAKYFSAHKMVLACGSPVFEAMFYGLLAEKKDPIELPDDDCEAFEIMLQHLYGESIVFQSIGVACKSYSIGDKYLITELKGKSAIFIRKFKMDEEHILEIIDGNHITNDYINQKFRSYIEENTHILFKCVDSQRMPEYVIKDLLQLNIMSASEYELLWYVTGWCSIKFKHSVKKKTQDLLQYIRFSLLTPRQFCLFTESFPKVLDTSTSLQILKHLNHPTKYHLPVWCSTNKAERRKCVISTT